ncbi:MAG TPA: hypothetical protein VG815_21800 [Chloroflexota bacterium]|nr:hypothetical protein [Chloroflexota bacterium]
MLQEALEKVIRAGFPVQSGFGRLDESASKRQFAAGTNGLKACTSGQRDYFNTFVTAQIGGELGTVEVARLSKVLGAYNSPMLPGWN